MIRILTDAAVQSTLEGVMETVEVRGTNGELLGFFSPACPETARRYAEAAARLHPGEVEHRKNCQEESFSTAQVLEHLQSLNGR